MGGDEPDPYSNPPPGEETGPQLLARLGTDATKWCAEMAKRGVVTCDHAPGSQFHGWMCNAIETARDAGYAEATARVNAAQDMLNGIERAFAEVGYRKEPEGA